MSETTSSQAATIDRRVTIPRPQVDPAIRASLDATRFSEELDLTVLRGFAGGGGVSSPVFNADTLLAQRPHLKHTEHSIIGPDGNTIILSVLSPKEPASSALPTMYHIHGGGQVAGDRFAALSLAMQYLGSIESVVVSVEYRLSPEVRAPAAAMDCYSGLVWVFENATILGIDPERIIVFGLSGGGPLAAATCLLARDKKVPTIPIRGQMLVAPMLDDRCESLSDKQFEFGTSWCGYTNKKAWDQVLGQDRGTDRVTPYQAPARATDLSNLPPTYIDAGECEVFRDSVVQFAMNMWRCGSTCEMHIWPGGYHGFDILGDSKVPLVRHSNEAKTNWVMRHLGVEPLPS